MHIHVVKVQSMHGNTSKPCMGLTFGNGYRRENEMGWDEVFLVVFSFFNKESWRTSNNDSDSKIGFNFPKFPPENKRITQIEMRNPLIISK